MEKMWVEHFYIPFRLPYFATLCKFATQGTHPCVHNIKSSADYSLSIAPDSRSLRRAQKKTVLRPSFAHFGTTVVMHPNMIIIAKYSIKVGAKAFWRLLRPRKSSGSEMLCSRSFDLLPPEMIQHIASFLPASSAAALAPL